MPGGVSPVNILVYHLECSDLGHFTWP